MDRGTRYLEIERISYTEKGEFVIRIYTDPERTDLIDEIRRPGKGEIDTRCNGYLADLELKDDFDAYDYLRNI